MYNLFHEDVCFATKWPNITTNDAMLQLEGSHYEPIVWDSTDPAFAETLQACRNIDGGVLTEGILSASATIKSLARKVSVTTYVDLTGETPPSSINDDGDMAMTSIIGVDSPADEILHSTSDPLAIRELTELEQSRRNLQDNTNTTTMSAAALLEIATYNR